MTLFRYIHARQAELGVIPAFLDRRKAAGGGSA